MVKPHLFPNCFLSPHGAAMVYVLLDAFRKLSHAPSVHLNFSEQSIQTPPNDTLPVAISTSKWPYWNILKPSSESGMYPETNSDLALLWQESTIWTVLYILECIGTIVWTCKIHLSTISQTVLQESQHCCKTGLFQKIQLFLCLQCTLTLPTRSFFCSVKQVYEIQTGHLKSSETKCDQVSFLRGHSSSKSILTSQTVSKTHQQSRSTNQLLGYGQ